MEMDCNKIYNKILTDEEFMEIKQHGSSDYPFQYYYDNLELFDFHCIEWHWHREFEFLYVESGQVTCGIGEKQIILSEGEAIFINSKILHRFYASSGGIIPNFVCMPEFIAPENSLIYKKYILPIISSNIYFQRFQTDELWQTKIIQTMIKIMEIQGNEKIRELATLALMQDFMAVLFMKNVKLYLYLRAASVIVENQVVQMLIALQAHLLVSQRILWNSLCSCFKTMMKRQRKNGKSILIILQF